MKKFLKNLKFSWKYAKDQKIKMIFYGLFNLLNVVISVIIPILSAKVIVNLTNNMFYQVICISCVIMGVRFISDVLNFCCRYFSQIVYRETFVKIQSELGKQILKIETSIIDKHGSGLFIHRLTSDTGRTADIFNVLNMNLSNILTDIGIFVAIFIMNKIVFIYLVVSVLILYIVEELGSTSVTEKDKIYRENHDKVSGFVSELVRGVRDIKMLNAEKSFLEKLYFDVEHLNKNRYEISKTDRAYRFILRCLQNVFELGLIILLVYLVKNKVITVAIALVIHSYQSKVNDLVYFIGMLLDRVKDFNLSSERIFSIINGKEFKKEKFGKMHLDTLEGNLEFKDVTFEYQKGEKVLNDLSFKVKSNSTVAFVGKSGAGKTTIFNLICKMYEIKKGNILLDGIDINKLDKDSIRGNITIISQNPYIFNLSIKDNLKLVKENVTDDEIKEACRLACLDKFIERLPDKYDTIVGEGGITLSGGQRQRLAIARAFIQKTEIILFDEATSSLDNETQESIQKAIENLQTKYTILIIAHRLSTIINSDRILFLNNGRIECEGTHKELLKKCKDYKNLYESELSSNK